MNTNIRRPQQLPAHEGAMDFSRFRPAASFAWLLPVCRRMHGMARSNVGSVRRIALAAAMLAIIASAQRSAAQATIFVTTTQQGVTDPKNCSLQEAIYSAEFGQNIAIGATSPDSAYQTGCVPGSGNGDTIVLQSVALSVHQPMGWGRAQSLWADGDADHLQDHHHSGQRRNAAMAGTGNSRLFAVGSASLSVNGNLLWDR